MTIFLIQVGRSRFELYSEAPEEATSEAAQTTGVFRRWAHAANVRWQAVVESAREGSARGLLARGRDALIRRVAESIAEQRTLWALRHEAAAALRFPSTLDVPTARRVLTERLAHATRHHLRWLVIDGLLLIGSAVFAVVPGPNVLAYYLAFRVFGHLSSWRGARHADHVAWQLEADDSLAELASLAAMPREARAPRVADIARRLNLSRLPTFFERMAA
jgi:hypothetical protein